MTASTATAAGLASCHDCGLLVRSPILRSHADVRCPRCRAAVHARKPDSLTRTWALLVGACICYVPANLFPVMRVATLGKVQEDTILSGVFFLVNHGMWPLALIVFTASFVVPLAKLIAITFLLVSVQRRSSWRCADRTRLYRAVEAIGRWSMVDIYVVTILVALVRLGALATIEAGLGALFFGCVVVLTMLAAETFDPRMIWDAAEASHD